MSKNKAEEGQRSSGSFKSLLSSEFEKRGRWEEIEREKDRGMKASKQKTEEVFAVRCGVFSVRSC